MLAFYQSATGKKVIDVMPQLTTEAMTQASQILTPQFLALVGQIENEETERVRKQVLEKAAKAKPKPAATKRPGSRTKSRN